MNVSIVYYTILWKFINSNLYGIRKLDEEARRILAGELLPTLSLLIKIVKILTQNQVKA